MVSAITPNTPDVNGDICVEVIATTATGDATVQLNFATNSPCIDMSIENPVLKVMHLGNTAVNFANSTLSDLAEQVKRNAAGTGDPDTAGEYKIIDANTIMLEKTADAAGIVFITYIAYGAQQQ